MPLVIPRSIKQTLALTAMLALLAPLVLASGGAKKEAGFVPLFNGENLDGWIGDKNSYAVENGAIASKEGGRGDLMTEKTYGDFVLRFDFKLTPGANNGLGIRQKRDSDGSGFDGIELQVIDNTAKKYEDLKVYQYHGSLYGVAGAQRGYLKPVGQWNHQQVTLDGRRVKVVLNGKTILNVNIDEAAGDELLRRRENLSYESGHLGFLGHDDRVLYRNIRIKELK